VTRRTLRLSRDLDDLLRTAAYLARTNKQTVIRLGLARYSEKPEPASIAHTDLSHAIFLLVPTDMDDEIRRLTALTGDGWSVICRNAIEAGSRHLIRQHYGRKVA
jgi:hypothetical protein